jgi:hypothetical protein
MKPTAPTDRTDLKTWTPAQLEYAAPFWVAKLEARKLSDLALVAYTPEGTQLRLDALKLHQKTLEQLRFWKLVLSDRIYRVLPPSLRTFPRNGSSLTHRGTAPRRPTKVGSWDKAAGIWD